MDFEGLIHIARKPSPYRAVNTLYLGYKTSQLMLYREIIAVCSQIHTKYINTMCGQNVQPTCTLNITVPPNNQYTTVPMCQSSPLPPLTSKLNCWPQDENDRFYDPLTGQKHITLHRTIDTRVVSNVRILWKSTQVSASHTLPWRRLEQNSLRRTLDYETSWRRTFR